MVATLGSGGSGGSVYIMDMSTIDSATVSRKAHERIERVASFDRTVWTADCNSDGTQVVLGELAILSINLGMPKFLRFTGTNLPFFSSKRIIFAVKLCI